MKKGVSYHLVNDMLLLNVWVVTGWPQKMLQNNKTVIFDLVSTAGSSGYYMVQVILYCAKKYIHNSIYKI